MDSTRPPPLSRTDLGRPQSVEAELTGSPVRSSSVRSSPARDTVPALAGRVPANTSGPPKRASKPGQGPVEAAPSADMTDTSANAVFDRLFPQAAVQKIVAEALEMEGCTMEELNSLLPNDASVAVSGSSVAAFLGEVHKRMHPTEFLSAVDEEKPRAQLAYEEVMNRMCSGGPLEGLPPLRTVAIAAGMLDGARTKAPPAELLKLVQLADQGCTQREINAQTIFGAQNISRLVKELATLRNLAPHSLPGQLPPLPPYTQHATFSSLDDALKKRWPGGTRFNVKCGAGAVQYKVIFTYTPGVAPRHSQLSPTFAFE